jgi:hypothetical protein
LNRQHFLAAASAAATAGLGSLGPITAQPAAAEPRFEFHSDFLVNLHHTLYYQAGVLQMLYTTGPDALPGLPARVYREVVTHIPSPEQGRWYRALRFYQNEYGWRSLIFDDEMYALENDLVAGTPPAQLKRVLDDVSPIYRERLWPIHDSLNRKSIEEWQAAVARYGPSFFPALANLYQRPWLPIPCRVDVVATTDRLGAYNNPGKDNRYWHIVMSTYDRENDDLHGFEIMTHEASHSIVLPDDGPIGGAIASACKALDRPEPNNLWHATIMYIPGIVLQRLAYAAGMHYELAFVANEVFTKAYPRYYAALQRHLLPYVDGRSTLGEALYATVAQVVSIT